MTLQEVWSLLNLYNSSFSGEQIDEAIGVILNGGISAAVEAAQQSADAAKKSASEAAGSAASVGAAATNAQSAASRASGSATEAESYAHGGTGTREGEDEDNARHYAALTAAFVAALNAAVIDGRGHLVFIAPDGSTRDLGDVTGEDGSSIQSITRTAGNGAPGTTDTYTVTLTDGSTTQFQVYNGKDGMGTGDMTAAVYDPQGKKQDVFQYVISQISTHNEDPNAHAAISKIISDHIRDTTKHITADERTKWDAMIPASQKGAAGGVASLGNDGKVPTGQLPATMTPAAHKASHMTGGSDALSPADIGAAAVSTIVTATLFASGWSSGTYVLTVSGVTATSNQEILPAVGITAEQLEALQAANIQDGGQTAGNITLKAYGDVPAIDIPIRVIKRGD